MKFWSAIWIVNFVIAGSSFATITGIVVIGGVCELRSMFKELKKQALSKGPL